MESAPQPADTIFRAISSARIASYLAACNGDRVAALDLYVWNAQTNAAYTESIGHVEIALRNVMAGRLATRHRTRHRRGSWLDDPASELDPRARDDIVAARRRVRAKRKPLSEGQVISELTFGFWRFLLTNRYRTTLWPDLARGFAHAPNRSLVTVEAPVVRLHGLRNRLAHHEPIWNKPLAAYQQDICAVLGYIDPDLRDWVVGHCRIETMLRRCPVTRPYP